MKSNYQKGDVVLVDLGKPPSEVVGHEQAYVRPGEVLANFEHLELLIVAPCSTQDKPYLHATAVKVDAGTGGLEKGTFILLHQIRTLSHQRIKRTIGRLPEDILA